MMLFTGMTLFAAAQQEVVNDPNVELRTVTGSFTSIKVYDDIDLFLSQGSEEAVAVSADDKKHRDAIKTEVVDGVLKVYYGERIMINWKNRRLRAYVSFKNVEKITVSGASDVMVSGVITVPSLYLNLSGSSDFKGAVQVTDLKMDLSGASDITIKGIATKVEIESSGASDVKGAELVTDYCKANASGASDITITVNKEISARASGSSDILYKGNAEIKESHTSGSSTVEKKGG